MDDSIIAVIAAISIGIIQLVISANKKKKVKERIVRSWADEERYGQTVALEGWEKWDEPEGLEKVEEMENDVLAPFRMTMPQNERIEPPMHTMEIEEIEDIEDEKEVIEETESVLSDFTPQKAILYAEVINPKWNS